MTAVSPPARIRASLPALRDRVVAKFPPLPRPPAYYVVCATVGVLNIVGLVMILSASSVAALSDYGSAWLYFDRQLMWALIGLVAFFVASRVDYHVWQKACPWLLGLALVLCTIVLIEGIGLRVDGSRRWLGFGAMRFQPSELAKFALLVAAAVILTRRADKLDDARQWFPVLGILAVFGALIMKEPDLDSTLVLALITFVMLVVAGARMSHLAKLMGAGIAFAVIAAYAEPYRRARMFAFLHPWEDTANTGYQIKQSLIALGSGGVSGVGLGAGRAKWEFLPNAHTDFIFAIIGEELGFVGVVLVLGLFAGFGLVGFHVARRAPDRFGMLLAAGITAWVVGQAVINLGAVVAVLPVSGITLPFLSAGGSSLVVAMLAAGIIANIARQTKPRPPHAPAPQRRVRRTSVS